MNVVEEEEKRGRKCTSVTDSDVHAYNDIHTYIRLRRFRDNGPGGVAGMISLFLLP
jgi:hypothetical protein